MNKIAPHFNHNIVVAKYSGLNGEPIHYSVECEDCFEVLADEDV